MQINWIALLGAAFSSLVLGFIWYNPKVFGTIWMKETEITMDPDAEKGKGLGGMLIMTFIYSFMVAFILQMLTIHQFGALGMVGGDPTKALPSYTAFLADYGTAYKTFKHGMLHGFMSGLFFALPVIGTSALYEKRSWKYVLVTGGFWVVNCMIMGGIVCNWAK